MRWFRRLLILLAALLVGVIAVIAVLMNLDYTRFSGNIEAIVEKQTGRSFSIRGGLELEVGRLTRILVSDVTLGNPEWATAEYMVHADQAQVVIDLWSLARGPVVIELLEISGTTVNLEITEAGATNWDFGAGSKPEKKPKTSITAPILKLAQVHKFELHYLDPYLEGPLHVRIEALEQRQADGGMLSAQLKGFVNGRPISIGGDYGPLTSLLSGQDLEYRLSGEFDSLKLTSNGHLDHFPIPANPSLKLEITGPDIDHLTDMLAMPDLGSGPLSLNAETTPESNGQTSVIAGRVGEFLINAKAATINLTQFEKIEIEGMLEGPDLSKLASVFKGMDIPNGPFKLSGKVSRNNKYLKIDHTKLEFGDANLSLDGSMNNFPELSNATVDLNITGTDLARFRNIARFPNGLKGPFNIAANLNIADGIQTVTASLNCDYGRLQINGEISESPGYAGTRLKFNGHSDNLNQLGRLFDVPDLIVKPLDFSGAIKLAAEKLVTYENLRIVVGDHSAEIEGTIGYQPVVEHTDIRIRATGPNLGELATIISTDLSDRSEPYNLSGRAQTLPRGYQLNDVIAKVGDATLEANGLISRNADLSGSNISVKTKGPDLRDLIDSNNDNIPAGPFQASANITMLANALQLEKVKGAVGGTTFSGDVKYAAPKGWSDVKESSANFDVEIEGSDIRTVLPASEQFELDEFSYELRAKGLWNNDQLKFDNVKLQIPDGSVSIRGTVDQPPDWSATQLTAKANITSLAKIGKVNGRRLPDVPLILDARFSGTTDKFLAEGITINIANSDLAGQFSLALGGTVPKIEGSLQSKLLDIATLLKARQKSDSSPPSQNEAQVESSRVIPDVALPIAQLKKFDVRVDLNIAHLRFRNNAYHDIALTGDLSDGNLRVQRATVSGETGTFSLSLDAKSTENSAEITATLDGSNMFLIADVITEDRASIPRFDGTISLQASGSTTHELIGTLDSSGKITSPGGRLPHSQLGLFYGDFITELFTSINPFAKEDPYTELTCFAVLFDTVNGYLTAKPGFVMQTNKMNILSNGTIDLNTERVDFGINTASRGKIGISAGQFINPYIKVAGTIGDPRLTLDATGTLVSGGAAVATLGLSILAKSVWDRLSRSEKPCEDAMAEAEKQKAGNSRP